MTTVLGLGVQSGLFSVLAVLACVAMAVADSGAARPTDSVESAEEVRRGMPMKPTGKSRTQLFLERIAIAIEPDLKGTPDRLQAYLSQFRLQAVNDRRMIAFDVQAEWDAQANAVVLSGHVQYEELRKTLAAYFNTLGFENVVDRVGLMPEAGLGEAPFAVVTAGSAFIYASPNPKSESVTQAAAGDTVFLLKDARDGFYFCQAWDGYVGFVEAAKVELIDGPAFIEAIGGTDSDKVEQAIGAGHTLLGTPYKWGGTTPAGIDCSGFTRFAYRHAGVLLPRDTDQQAAVGRLTATRTHREGMQRGDLMFFLNARGRINHTGIYLGDGTFIESGGDSVRISSLNPGDENYSEKRDHGFAFAKRPMQAFSD